MAEMSKVIGDRIRGMNGELWEGGAEYLGIVRKRLPTYKSGK